MNPNRTARRPRSRPTGIRALAAGLLLPAIAWGCGGDDRPGIEIVPATVSGKVLLPDGKPMSGGKVIFEPEEDGFPKPVGDLQADGGFTLKNGSDEKILPGPYAVRIDNSGPAPSMPPKYKSILTSGCKATVKPGQNALEPFKMDNAPAALSSQPGGSSVRD